MQKVFVDLYADGLIYRDYYMVNWDPGSRSAISDLEVEDREVTDTLYEIAYPLADGDGEVVVATVRPETMLADTAVAVNPDDERFTHLAGRSVTLPLVGRTLPVIVDDYVKTDFGTGCLKITPGHDPNDFEIGRRHGLGEITVIGEDGRMNEEAGEYAGLTVLEARERVVAALRAQGLLRGEEPYTHTVPFSHRSGERIEPLISLQWFMQMDELAGPAIEAVTSGRVKIHPESQSRRYVDWLENIRPWCISRQLWWGHQLPVWYRGDDETHVGMEPPQGDGWTRDEDVLDTWFSSALWPFATLGWPDETPDLRAFYPTDVLSTARDILFLWVARMVMMGLRFAGDIPFDHVYVHSVIQAPDGRRMSKSLGTGIDPLEEIDKHGADAVRFGLLAMSSTQDVRYSSEKVEQGQSLATKLFNASRFVLLNVQPGRRGRAAADDRGGPLDPLAAAARDRRHLAPDRRVRVRQGGARALRLRLRRALRLVPRARQGPRLRRRPVGDAAARAGADAGARPPGDPVRDRGDLGPRARHRGPARRLAVPAGRPGAARRAGRGADRRGHRGRARGPRVAQRGGRRRGRRAAGAAAGHRLRRTPRRSSRGSRAWTSRPAPRTIRTPRRACPCPAAPSSCCPRPASTRRSRSAGSRPAAPSSKGRSGAPRASSRTPGSSPRRRPELVEAERGKLEQLREELAAI